MKVEIDDGLFIESDGMQFIIKKYDGKVDKDGAEISKTLGYYSTLAGAVRGLVKIELMSSKASTVSELISDVERIKHWIQSKIDI